MTPREAKRLLEVEYLMLEYDITPADQRPPIAIARIARWRSERERLRRKRDIEALRTGR